MAPTTPASSPRKLLEQHFSQLTAELEESVEGETACQVAAARRELSESLNQAVRRLRQAGKFADVATVLADSSAPFSNRAAIFRVIEDSIAGERVRGMSGDERTERFAALRFAASAGGAFATVLEAGEPVVAMSGEAEVSAELCSLFDHRPEDRVYIFPLWVRGKTVGLFYCWGDAQPAALELLSQAGAVQLETLTAAVPAAAPGLVTIAAAAGEQPVKAVSLPEWSELPPVAQQIHLRARRFARVAVAEMRLYYADALAKGLTQGDLYGALQSEMDAAREAYRRDFLPAAGLPDYLHQEMLRTLTNDDAGLLGEKYPGPLV